MTNAPMTTRTDTAAGRVTVWRDGLHSYAWRGPEDRCYGPFASLAAAVADAQRVHGPAVAITHHTAPKARHGEHRAFSETQP